MKNIIGYTNQQSRYKNQDKKTNTHDFITKQASKLVDLYSFFMVKSIQSVSILVLDS